MMRHTRLQSLEQVIACLDMINEAVRRVTGDIAATLYAVDERGNCFIATQTQQSILRVWQEAIAGRAIAAVPEGLPRAPSASPFTAGFPAANSRPEGLDTRPMTSADNRQGVAAGA